MPDHCRYIFLIGFLVYAFSASAQNNDDAVMDTMVTIPNRPATEQRDTITFDPPGPLLPVRVRSLRQKALDSLLADDDYWYANAVPVKKKQPEQTENKGRSLFDRSWFRDVLWFLILGSFIAIVVWYLVSSNILIFRRQPKVVAPANGEAGALDDIFTIDYEKEIAGAVEAGNYRLAVRLWYLNVLKELSDRGKINYRFGSTNHDYVMQLSGTALYRDFFRLTRNFEYTWYGQFDLSAEAYEMMRTDFSTFKKAVR